MSNFSHKAPLSTRRLTMNAVFIALYVVLDFTSVYISNEIKLSFAAFPLLVASMLFGYAGRRFCRGNRRISISDVAVRHRTDHADVDGAAHSARGDCWHLCPAPWAGSEYPADCWRRTGFGHRHCAGHHGGHPSGCEVLGIPLWTYGSHDGVPWG